MNQKFSIHQEADIGPALDRISKTISEEKASTETRISILLCEELLRHLLASGYQDIQLRAKSGRRFQLHVDAPGEEDSLKSSTSSSEDERISSEINLLLLNQYRDHLRLGYSHGVNHYTISTESSLDKQLQEEVFHFYQKADPSVKEKPFALLLEIFRCHPVRIILSMIIILLKHGGALMIPIFASRIIDNFMAAGTLMTPKVYMNIVGTLAALILNLVCFGLLAKVYHRFTRSMESALKMALLQKVQLLSMDYHNHTPSGLLLSKLISDIPSIQLLLFDRTHDMVSFLEDVVYVIITALIVFPPMLLFYVVMIPAAVLMIRSYSGRILKSRVKMRKRLESSNSAFKEMLEMKELIRVHGLEKTQARDIAASVHSVQEAADQVDDISFHANNFSYGGFQSFRLICLCFVCLLAARGLISIGMVVLFQSIFDMMITGMQKILDSLPDVIQGVDGLISINEILLEDRLEKNGTQKLPNPFRGEITLEHLNFGYSPDKDPILSDVSLKIPAGKTVAFMGGSGQGKTTLMNLMLGLLEKEGGQLLIDGIDIDDLDKRDYRRQIAVVPQNTTLFTGTLWDNLVYGLSYVSTQQVRDALKSVGLLEMVDGLPDGLQTMLSPGGQSLSGGQRQRVAIARALLRKAKVVFFDEATSALDNESEAKVQEAMDALCGKCTVVMIAHRLNTLRKADYIYQIEDGKAILRSFDSLQG